MTGTLGMALWRYQLSRLGIAGRRPAPVRAPRTRPARIAGAARQVAGARTCGAWIRHSGLDDGARHALDLAAQADLRGLLRRLAQQGTGILLITHHIADIPPEIDRVLMMREGRIVADGSKEELLTASRLSELFRTEVQLSERDGFFHAW